MRRSICEEVEFVVVCSSVNMVMERFYCAICVKSCTALSAGRLWFKSSCSWSESEHTDAYCVHAWTCWIL